MGQQQNWQQSNQVNTNQHQYILPVEPSQDTDQQEEFDPYIIPPATQPSKEQDNNNSKEHNQRSRSNRGRGKGRGRGRGPPEGPQKLYCHFHGVDASHRTNQCPEKKKMLERMEVEKKAKLVGHTSWPIQQAQQFQTTQPTFNPPF